MVSAHDEQLAAEKQRTERVTKRILTEEEMSALSDRLMQVTKGMTVTVRYFKEDTTHPEVPAVGNYITLTGKADRIDPVFRTLQVGDTVVPFEDLVEISGEGIMEIANISASPGNKKRWERSPSASSPSRGIDMYQAKADPVPTTKAMKPLSLLLIR